MKAHQLINKYWPATITPVTDDEEIFEAVRARIRYLLDNDMERLLHTLYRVDVPEDRVKYVLGTTSPDVIDNALTELILERISQKLETRSKYSN